MRTTTSFASPPSLSADFQRARSEAQKQLTAQIAATLGEQRYSDYRRSIDQSYQQTAKLVARLELPPAAANQVHAIQEEIQHRAKSLAEDRTLTAADRDAQLAALAAEANSNVTSVLGARGYEAHKTYGGSWLYHLTPSAGPKQ